VVTCKLYTIINTILPGAPAAGQYAMPSFFSYCVVQLTQDLEPTHSDFLDDSACVNPFQGDEENQTGQLGRTRLVSSDVAA
jgi:hypothetical protein